MKAKFVSDFLSEDSKATIDKKIAVLKSQVTDKKKEVQTKKKEVDEKITALRTKKSVAVRKEIKKKK